MLVKLTLLVAVLWLAPGVDGKKPIASKKPSKQGRQDAIIRKILDEEVLTANRRKKSSYIFQNGININAGNRPDVLDIHGDDTEGKLQQEQINEEMYKVNLKRKALKKNGPPVEPFVRKENAKAKSKVEKKVKPKPATKFNISKGKSSGKQGKKSKNNKSSNGKRRKKRMITALSQYLWTNGIIPYTLGLGLDAEDIISIARAQRLYEYWTCTRFPEWTSTTQADYGLDHNNRLNLDALSGCWSYVGNNYWQGQDISCCNSACPHELGHALGMPHGHQLQDRDKWIRINTENIDAGNEQWFSLVSPQTRYYPFDMASTMHYNLWAFNSNGKQTITVLNPDNTNIVGSTSGDPDFYDYYTINSAYQCAATHCSGFTTTCSNDGYTAYIDSVCQCACPEGLDQLTGCQTVYKGTSASKTLNWPSGTYALPETVHGCPTGTWQTGSHQHCGDGSNDWSSNLQISAVVNSLSVDRKFCVKTADSGSNEATWSAGSYCILRKGGSCPTGFSSGSVTYDNVDASCSTNSGTLPDGVFGDDTTMEFCCRSDGGIDEPIVLPTSTHFALFRSAEASGCQTIKDMVASDEYIQFDMTNPSVGALVGKIPSISIVSGTDYELYYCYYTPLNQACGDVIDLTVSNAVATVTSPGYPGAYSNDMECFYFIKAPEGSTISLEFNAFDVEGGNSCNDYLEIRSELIGQPGNIICGDSYKTTTLSSYNTMMLTLRTDSGGTNTGFSGTVKLKQAADSCLSETSNGIYYRGSVDYTVDFERCLPWKEVTHCINHPYLASNLYDDLTDNYCRNPGEGTRPWCYNDAEDCRQNYCDVCNIENCYDIFPDCSGEITANSNYCSEDPEAFRGCQDTCGFCASRSTLPAASTITCGSPPGFADGVPVVTLNPPYNPGESVQFNCDSGEDQGSLLSICMDDGTWSGTGPVCGYCGVGWTYFNGRCYIPVLEELKMSGAQSSCASRGGIVASGKDAAELAFVHSLCSNGHMWIGMTDAVTEGSWVWFDGTPLTWTNWNNGEPNNYYNFEHCAIVQTNGKISDVYCEYYNFHNFVCSKPGPTLGVCSDRRDDCETLMTYQPSMCTAYGTLTTMQCQESCGICDQGTAVPCVLPSPANADASTTADLTIGQTVSYTCQSGYVLTSGNLERACLRSGQLTGLSPQCTATDQATSIVNTLSMRPRQKGPVSRYYFTVNDDRYKIQQNGKVTAWRFYARGSGSIAFQVWKPDPIDENKFTLVGSNAMTAKGGRTETVNIPTNEQIAVEPGYLIGLYYQSTDYAEIPYDTCIDAMYWKYIFSWDGDFVNGNDYTFSAIWWYDCRLWSFSAIVGPIV